LIGTYIGSYLKKRGENYATKQDIKEITLITKNIESQISFSNWTKRRQWELKREVYTELIKNLYELIKKTKLHYIYPGEESDPTQPLDKPELVYDPSSFSAGTDMFEKIYDYKAIADIALHPDVNKIIINLSEIYLVNNLAYPPEEYLIKNNLDTQEAYKRILDLAKHDLEIE